LKILSQLLQLHFVAPMDSSSDLDDSSEQQMLQLNPVIELELFYCPTQKGTPSDKAHGKVWKHKETAIHLHKDQLWQSLQEQAQFEAS